jgi:hypothetical protein
VKLIAGFLLLGLVVVFAGIQVAISRGVDDVARAAVAQYPGPAADALIAYVDCESCPLRERNRAVWALGQMREVRALPVIRKYQTGEECDHARALCQHEIRKALSAIDRRSPVWLGYCGKSIFSSRDEPGVGRKVTRR